MPSLKAIRLVMLGLAWAWLATLGITMDSAHALVVVQAEWQIAEESFDQWVFQNNGNASQAGRNLKLLLELQIEGVDQACELSPEQRRKLELAGTIDIRSFFDRVEDVRDQFLLVRLDQEAFNKANIWQKIAPLQQELAAGLFGPQSFFQKVRRSTLTAKQRREFRAVDHQRRAFAYEAKVRLALVNLENNVPMTHEQRESFVRLVLDQTPPPLRFGQNDQHYVHYQFSRLSTHAVAQILNGDQVEVMHQIARRHRSRRAYLIQQGFLADEPDSIERAAGDVPLGEASVAKFKRALKKILESQHEQ